MLMLCKYDYVCYLMAATLQEVDFVQFVEIVGTVEVFGVQVVAMRYIAAGILLWGYLMLL